MNYIHRVNGNSLKLLSIALTIIILCGLSFRPQKSFKFIFFLMGMGSCVVGLVGCSQSRDEREIERDYQAIEREARLEVWERQLMPPKLTPLASPKAQDCPTSLIRPAPQDWLKNAVIKAFHIRINGQTGSGKSTLTDNAIALARASLGSDCEVVLIDPKYPLSDWDIEPQYKGINEVIAGLENLANMVESRLKIARKSKDQKGRIPDFPPILYVVDEIDWIASEYEKEAIKLLKIGLKVGRALNVKVIYVGQTPLCSDLKLRRNDFNHSSNIFLGENARTAIEKEACYDSREKTELRAEYSERIAKKQPYLGLIKEPGKRAYFAVLPPPKAYQGVSSPEKHAPQLIELSDSELLQREWLESMYNKRCDDSVTPSSHPEIPGYQQPVTPSQPSQPSRPKCPHCQSLNTKNNGSSKGKPRFKCGNCKKTFGEQKK